MVGTVAGRAGEKRSVVRESKTVNQEMVLIRP